MEALIDIHIVVDHFTGRQPAGPGATALWNHIIHQRLKGYVCANTLTTFSYFMEKMTASITTQHVIRDIMAACEVLTLDRQLLEKALQKAWSDYEDAVQDAAAESAGIPIIVTHNPKDFAGSSRRIVDAATLVQEIDQQSTPMP